MSPDKPVGARGRRGRRDVARRERKARKERKARERKERKEKEDASTVDGGTSGIRNTDTSVEDGEIHHQRD